MPLTRRRALIGLFAALPAFAARADDDDDDCRNGISRRAAVALARRVGLVRVREIECDDDEWEIEGRDAHGRRIEVEIDARSGRVTEIDRDD